MNVFISWSGSVSREVAELLHEYLPRFLHALDRKVFLSSEDIHSGSVWIKKLLSALERSEFGIVCLTPNNVNQPWLLFEAGSLSRMKQERVCGFLLGGLQMGQVPDPLGVFQHREFSKEGLLRVIEDINDALGRKKIRRELLVETFEDTWPKIKAGYDKAVARAGSSSTPLMPATESYRRVIPKVPASGAEIKELKQTVESIRESCFRALAKAMPEASLDDSQVRANMFVPDTATQFRGAAFELYMHPMLRSNMKRREEYDIRFGPGEGGTGTAFDDGEQLALFQADFAASPALRALIHPKLRWFVSTPISGSDGTPLAVLNVDGLDFNPTQELLAKTAASIKKQSAALATILDRFPKHIIMIQHVQHLAP